MPETVVHFQIRIRPDIHEKMASWALNDKVSLNALVVEVLQNAMKEHEAKDKKKPAAAR
jgi:predicted HicB family RNase H-like nuclease